MFNPDEVPEQFTSASRGELREAYAQAVDEARSEITRTDGKAGTLLTLATGALALMVALGTQGHRVSAAAAVTMWITAALDGAAGAVLLTAIKPRLPRGGMFRDHAVLLDIHEAAELEEWQRDRLRLMSGLAHAKHRRIRLAVNLLLVSLATLAVAATLTFAL